MKKRIYSVRQFCKRYGISRKTFYREINLGRLWAFKIAHRTFVDSRQAASWHRQRTLRHRKFCGFVSYFKLIIRLWK